ncbi:MAG: hypothetical protein A2Y62_08335 [Candidatus Fischerbacteria bacterium RBG_13_37_8]|uniref:Uncharacterized protein n=1 Tax=Candidatus Fischerbacteria bacterium RBG_13_37_8 TaxID=1817863 RepID=A0A1F5VHC9_9BACT|nr:MAG: hypothetical protein A2Y62_08335 [Candidatus Fischerbacteria bacterium RBG_13_37_8]
MTNKVKLLLIVLSVFVAAVAIASNMGFKLNYALLTNTGGNNANWVSIPYFDNYANANDVCTDINTVDCTAGTATTVTFFDTATNAYTTYACGGKNPPAINAGRAYSVFAAAGSACTWKLVGSHDDSYDSTNGISFTTNTANNNMNWVAIPYHTQSANFNGLCIDINADCANVVTQVTRFDTANNSYVTYACGGKNPPTVNAGDGLGIFVSSAPGAACWHPSHY